MTSADAEGEVSISVLAVDQRGNVAGAVDVTTDGSQVVIDETPPTFTAVTVASTNPTPNLARAGDWVGIHKQSSLKNKSNQCLWFTARTNKQIYPVHSIEGLHTC